MAYASWSVVFGEQPSAAKWNLLGSNDASFNDGTGLNSGSTQQIVYVVSSAVASGTTIVPYDDTIPQITEGTEFLTLAITPKSTSNILVINANLYVSNSVSNNYTTGALFQDATANALAASSVTDPITGGSAIAIRHVMVAGTASSTTFRARAGGSSASTTTFNGNSAARRYGAITKSSIVITEYKA